MIIYYATEPVKVNLYKAKYPFQIHFTINVMLKMTFLQRIASARDLI